MSTNNTNAIQHESQNSNHEIANMKHLERIQVAGDGRPTEDPPQFHRTSSHSTLHAQPSASVSYKHRNNTISNARTLLGLQADAPISADHAEHHHTHKLPWSTIRATLREPFAEFFGTFIMVLFGDMSVAQVLLSAGQKEHGVGNGPDPSISWG